MDWIAAILIFCGWMGSMYKEGNGIQELKNQIISLSYYAGLSHEQIQELKKMYGIK